MTACTTACREYEERGLECIHGDCVEHCPECEEAEAREQRARDSAAAAAEDWEAHEERADRNRGIA